jgi:amino acid transporter
MHFRYPHEYTSMSDGGMNCIGIGCLKIYTLFCAGLALTVTFVLVAFSAAAVACSIANVAILLAGQSPPDWLAFGALVGTGQILVFVVALSLCVASIYVGLYFGIQFSEEAADTPEDTVHKPASQRGISVTGRAREPPPGYQQIV